MGVHLVQRLDESLPMRGEWIEITATRAPTAARRSLPMRGEWIEIFLRGGMTPAPKSLPMRGEWIEILQARF